MRVTFLFIIISLILSVQAHASVVCGRLFEEPFESKIVKLETHTHGGKPRYFSVRNHRRFVGGEIDLLIQSMKNLTQFSERLSEVNTYMPDLGSLPSEAFFVANQIIPLIETHLSSHGVNFRIETYESMENKRTLVVIAENGTNPLNTLAKLLWDQRKISLTVDPIELFYGYKHYNQSRGKFFDIDAENPGYAMSFYLLMHSQHRNFNFNISKTDLELHRLNVEIQGELVVQKIEVNALGKEETEVSESRVRENQRRAHVIQGLIDKARARK
ncbi:MAG: hypothetical protein V4596_07360 [Bdellovibrionota bacterium]